LDREGLTYEQNGKSRTWPEVAVERDSWLSFARLVRELCLDLAPPEDTRPRRRGFGR
jgi:hypothetical protein